jgi:hypothetical protein
MKLLQNPKAIKAIVKNLGEAIRNIPVKQILSMIGPAITKIRVLLEQVVTRVIEFAMKKAGRLPVFK